MPFTPSHAVVALPFVRTPLPAGVLAVGAMAPDLPLYISAGPSYAETHGWPALLWTSLPIAVVLYALWRLVVRPAVSGLLPPSFGARIPVAWDARASAQLREWSKRSPSRLARDGVLVVVAAFLGVGSHVLWDLFTHESAAGAELFPALAQEWGGAFGATWLQYGSTVFGLAVIAAWLVWATRKSADVPRADPPLVARIRRSVISLAAFSLVALYAAATLSNGGLPDTTAEFATWAFLGGTRAAFAILAILLVAGFGVQVARSRAEADVDA